MNEEEIDLDMIGAVILEINDRLKLLLNIYPKDKNKEFLLKNLAAASIHITFFVRDLYNHENKQEKTNINEELESEFLKECGCNMELI